MNVVNWPLLKNPLNWLTVWSMVLILGLLIHLFLQYGNQRGIFRPLVNTARKDDRK